MADAGLGHDGDGDGGDDLLDKLGVGHAGDAAFGTDHGRHALKSHDGDSAGFLGDARLFDVHDVHDDSTLEHLSQTGLEAEGGGAEVAVGNVVCHDESPYESRSYEVLRTVAAGIYSLSALLVRVEFRPWC